MALAATYCSSSCYFGQDILYSKQQVSISSLHVSLEHNKAITFDYERNAKRAERSNELEGSENVVQRVNGKPVVGKSNRRQLRLNAALYASQLRRCGDEKALSEGKRVHALISRRGHDGDTYVGNLLIQMYGKCGSIEDAELAFGRIYRQNVYSFNLMISAYIQNEQNRETLEVFKRMESEGIAPDMYTFSSILSACSKLGDLAEGKAFHERISRGGLEASIVVENALLDMYAKCGSLIDCEIVFDKMSCRTVVSWNAMIAAYAQHGHSAKALELYRRMDSEGVMKPDEFTYSSIMSACSKLGTLGEGAAIHACIDAGRLESSVVVGNAIVDMYGKCGGLADAKSTFEKMKLRNEASWNAMIAAYAQHGYIEDVLQLYQRMDFEGMGPNQITFTSILRACSHAGMLEEAIQRFHFMQGDHYLTPVPEQYRCMIDLLGRAGWLKEAEELIETMPFSNDTVAWLTLLGACGIHNDVQRGIRAANKVLELDPDNAAPAYVLLSNIYTVAGRWTDAAEVRQTMLGNDMKKQAGRGLIEIDNKVHEFSAGKVSHPARVVE